eukprot:scaffold58689_cov63-Phaeocystis_antarctica.AAC.8
MRLDAPEPAALGHVTGYLHEFHVVEANAALPSAAHVVAGVAAAAEVGIVTEEGAHRGAAGLGHVSVNHSPTLRGRVRHPKTGRAVQLLPFCCYSILTHLHLFANTEWILNSREKLARQSFSHLRSATSS